MITTTQATLIGLVRYLFVGHNSYHQVRLLNYRQSVGVTIFNRRHCQNKDFAKPYETHFASCQNPRKPKRQADGLIFP